jgi:hypothetical protein
MSEGKSEGKFGEGKDDYDDDTMKNESKEDQQRREHQEGKTPDEPDPVTDDDLVSAVQEYFYADESLARTFEGFVKRRASIVDLEAIEKGDEYKLEYTEAFQEYKDLFEKHMTECITGKLNCSLQRFYTALQKKTDEDENSNEAIFGQILLAVTEFDVFMTMMREEARNIAAAASRK